MYILAIASSSFSFLFHWLLCVYRFIYLFFFSLLLLWNNKHSKSCFIFSFEIKFVFSFASLVMSFWSYCCSCPVDFIKILLDFFSFPKQSNNNQYNKLWIASICSIVLSYYCYYPNVCTVNGPKARHFVNEPKNIAVSIFHYRTGFIIFQKFPRRNQLLIGS